MMRYSGLLSCTTSSASSTMVMAPGRLRSISSSLWVRSDALYGSMDLLFLCQVVPCFSLVAMDMPCTPKPFQQSLFVLFWARFSGIMITHALFYHILSLISFSPSGMWCFCSHEFTAPYDDDCSFLISMVVCFSNLSCSGAFFHELYVILS